MVKKAANKFGKSERRMQQVTKEVGDILDELCDVRVAHLCVWLPGIDDPNIVRGELKRLASLRYKKPQPQRPPKLTKGRVTKREKRKAKLTEKHPDLEKKLINN